MRSRYWRLLALLFLGALLAAPALSAQSVPNDPEYGRQRYLDVIHAPAAWSMERGNRDLIIAVLSSGMAIAHRDLSANVWQNPRAGIGGCGADISGCNFSGSSGGTRDCLAPTRESAPSSDVRDQTGLGSALAGIAGAVTNNALDIAGVAWNVRLMPVKVSGCIPATGDGIAAGVTYAVEHGARVILLGVDEGSSPSNCSAPNPTLTNVLRDAQIRGVVIIAGSGSGGGECVEGVAAQPGVIAVGAAALAGDGALSRAAFGQAGPEVALAAPGVNILGTVPSADCRFCDPSGLRPVSGTAPAAALVTGAAALLLSRDSLLGPFDVRDLLTRGATPIPTGRSWSGAGLVDVARSISLVPASFTGSLRGGPLDASVPVVITATIGGVRCAESTALVRDGRLSYVLHVPPAATNPACGAPGALVTLSAGSTILATLPWRQGVQVADLTLPSTTPPGTALPIGAPAPITPASLPLTPSALPQPAPATNAAPVVESIPAITPVGPADSGPLPSADLVGVRSRTEAQLIALGLTATIDSSLSTVGANQERFVADDIQVVLWTTWGGDARHRTVRFVWVRPDSTTFREVELDDECPCVAATRWRLDAPGPLGGDKMLDNPGAWQIDIYMDGEYIGSVPFEVAS